MTEFNKPRPTPEDEALKLALEALTYIYTETTVDEDELIDQAITAIKEALAQTQEPVVCCQQYDTCLQPCTPRGEHLAQRTWVGLTDKERSELVTLHHGWNEYGQAIEAKLKEKNT